MKEKIKELLTAAVLIILGAVFIVRLDGWVWYIGGFIPVTNTILGGIIAVSGIIILISSLKGKK